MNKLIKKFQEQSINVQLPMIYVGVALIILLPSLVLFLWQTTQTITTQTGLSLQTLSRSNAQQLSVELIREIELLASLSNDDLLATRITLTSETELTPLAENERQQRILEQEAIWLNESDSSLQSDILLNAASSRLNDFRNAFPIYQNLIVVDRYGTLVASERLHVPTQYLFADESWWQAILSANVRSPIYIGDPVIGEESFLLPIALPIFASNTQVKRGVLYATLEVNKLETFSNINLPEAGELFLVDGEGKIVYGTDTSQFGQTYTLPTEQWQQQTWQDQAIIASASPVIFSNIPNTTPLVSQPNWSIVTLQATRTALAPVIQFARIAILSGLAILLIGSLVGRQSSKFLLASIKNLSETGQKIVAGDLSQRASEFGPQEIRSLARGFNVMTGKLENLINELEQRVQDRTVQLETSLHQTNLLLESAHQILGATDIETICNNASYYAQQMIQPDRLALYIVDQQEASLTFSMNYGDNSPTVSYDELMDGLGGVVLKTGQPILSNDPDDGQEPAETYQQRVQVNAWRLVIVPLMLKEKVIGNITAMNGKEKRPFTTQDIERLANIATQATATIESANLFYELQEINKHLDQMVQTRTTELQKAYELLSRLDTTKDNFIQVIAHELRTPLTKIQMSLQMLLYSMEEDNSFAPIVEGGLTGVDRLYKIVNDMLDISRLDYNMLERHIEEVSISFVFKQLLKNFKTTLEERQQTVTLTSLDVLPTIEGDPDLLTKMFYHLIMNAIKYTPDSGKISIEGKEVQLPDGRAGVQITVTDTGIGIDPQEQELIFEKFYQTGQVEVHSTGDTKFKGGGPGIGLSLAKGIAQVHGGQIWVESTGHDEQTYPGSVFFVQLPIQHEPHLMLTQKEDILTF